LHTVDFKLKQPILQSFNQAAGLLLGLDDRGHAVQRPLANSRQAAQWAITPAAISGGR
jgi:hypothetical protein